jgi:hypothetical protein
MAFVVAKPTYHSGLVVVGKEDRNPPPFLKGTVPLGEYFFETMEVVAFIFGKVDPVKSIGHVEFLTLCIYEVVGILKVATRPSATLITLYWLNTSLFISFR